MTDPKHNAENGEKKNSSWLNETIKFKKEADLILDSIDEFSKKHIPIENEFYREGYINGYIVGKRSAIGITDTRYTPEQVHSMLEALRKRCAEEAKTMLVHKKSKFATVIDKQSILSIDLTQFLQK